MQIVRTMEELERIYPGPVTLPSHIKVTSALTSPYRRMIEASPFVALATIGPEGLDCSPRGDRGGVVRIVDDKTLHLPDWRGNNRIDSLRNIVRDPRLALMFLVPGSNTVMRVNGRGLVSNDATLLAGFTMDGRHPRSVVIVTIDEVYFQCARAVMRAELWDASTFMDPQALPAPGEMLKAATGDFDAEAYDRQWPARAAQTMW